MVDYLHRCLDSLVVCDEQMQLLEVLVINDGSEDGSSQIAHEYQNRYPQTFRVIDKENGNYGSCVNRGIDEAMGKYFRILDADDYFDKEGFSKYLTVLTTTDADMVVTQCIRKYEDGRKRDRLFPIPKGVEYGRLYDAGELDYYEMRCRRLLCMHANTYKLSILRQIQLRLQTGISYTDTEYAYYPLAAVKTIMLTGIMLYIYIKGREGQSVQFSGNKKQVDDLYLVSKRILDDFIQCAPNRTDLSLRRKQLIVLGRVTGSYYRTSLQYLKIRKDTLEWQRRKEFAGQIKSSVPDLYKKKVRTKMMKGMLTRLFR